MTQDRPWASRPASRDGGGLSALTRAPGSGLGRTLLVTLIVIGASGLLALAIVDPRFTLLLVPPVALAGLWWVGAYPFAAVCLVLVLSATLISETRFKVPVGPLDLRLTELILGALLLVALVRPKRAWWGGAAGGSLLIFLAVLAAAAVFAVASGRAGPVDAYHYTRSLAPVVVFFVIVRLFPDPGTVRRLLVVATVMAAVVGFVSVLAASPGAGVVEFLDPSEAEPGAGPPPASEQTGMGLVNRVRLPGVALAYVVFWFAALNTLRARGNERLAWGAVLGGISLAIVLSFNRNMWLGLALGSVVVFLLTHTRVRRQFAIGLLVLIAAATLFGLSGTRIERDSPVYPVVARFTTLFQPEQEARNSSLTDRFYENRYALEAIRENPLTGVGPGAPYGLTYVENLGNRVFERGNALFLHNQYLHLLLIGGPLALLSFLAFLLAPVVSGWRTIRRDDLYVALTVAIAMTLLSAIVMLSFVSATSALVLGLVVGVLAVAASRPEEAGPAAAVVRA